MKNASARMGWIFQWGDKRKMQILAVGTSLATKQWLTLHSCVCDAMFVENWNKIGAETPTVTSSPDPPITFARRARGHFAPWLQAGARSARFDVEKTPGKCFEFGLCHAEKILFVSPRQTLCQCLAGPRRSPEEIWETPSNTGECGRAGEGRASYVRRPPVRATSTTWVRGFAQISAKVRPRRPFI